MDGESQGTNPHVLQSCFWQRLFFLLVFIRVTAPADFASLPRSAYFAEMAGSRETLLFGHTYIAIPGSK